MILRLLLFTLTAALFVYFSYAWKFSLQVSVLSYFVFVFIRFAVFFSSSFSLSHICCCCCCCTRRMGIVNGSERVVFESAQHNTANTLTHIGAKSEPSKSKWELAKWAVQVNERKIPTRYTEKRAAASHPCLSQIYTFRNSVQLVIYNLPFYPNNWSFAYEFFYTYWQ